MRWRKLGLVYAPDGSETWAQTHAMVPTPVLMPDGGLRVYFASCDAQMVGRATYVDLDPLDPTRVLRVARRPVLDVGRAGCFDDNGVVPTCAVWRGNELWLYYFGFQLGVRIRYLLFSGLAVSSDGGETFERVSETPILDRRDGEALFRSAPFAMPMSDAWRIWYISGNSEIMLGSKSQPFYNIRQLDSANGIDWLGEGRVAVALNGEDEYGLGRPYVFYDGREYQLYFSVRMRSCGYRFGLAVSKDAETWERRDADIGLDVSADGWDSEAVSFSAVINSVSKACMFYNGNGFGRTGFGLAVREE